MRKLHFVFLLFAAIALVLFICKRQQVNIPFLSNYGNDILFIPLVCWIAETVMKRLYGPHYELPITYIWLTCAYTAILFEGVIPVYKTSYTADWFDVICYACGSFIYLMVTRRIPLGFIFGAKATVP